MEAIVKQTPGASGRLVAVTVALIAAGFFLFVIGLFPGLFGLDWTPGIGLLQITTLLLGITVMTVSAYVYARLTLPKAEPARSLRAEIGVRLMATGLVVAYGSGYADLLGIGSGGHGGPLVFGPVKAAGVALGVLVIAAGLFLYTRPRA
jgi:hypothetical protein